VVLRGRATNVAIAGGETAQVSISAPGPIAPNAETKQRPVIDAIASSAALVAPGSTINLSVTAHSPDQHALTYLWRDNCGGSFGKAEAAATTWKAPAKAAVCRLSVRVADPTNSTSATGYVVVVVRATRQTVRVNATVDTYPVLVFGAVDEDIVFQSPAPDGLTVGITADIAATASDPDGSAVTYAWSSTCGGTFSPSKAVGSVRFHHDDPRSFCTLILAVTDTSGHTTEGIVMLSGFLCAEVTCPPGEVCDSADGVCKKIEVCPCTPPDLCHLSSCDPVTSRCLVDPVTCAPASDRCHVQGTCNLSTGTCSAETSVVCPPASDRCHVKGACDLSTGTCSAETSVACPAGQACDPSNGRCRGPTPALQRADGRLVGATFSSFDATGAIYRAGSLSAPFNFGSGRVRPAGGADVYVGRFNPATGKATWAFRYGDAADQIATGLAVSSSRLGIIGTFKGTLDFSGGFKATNTTAAAGLPFIALLDPRAATATTPPAATYLRPVMMGPSSGPGSLSQIASNPGSSRFAVCGTAQGVLANLPGIRGSAGGARDIVVAVIDPDVADGILWARQIGGKGDQTCAAVAFDSAGNVIITGTYSAGSLDFGAGPLSPAATGSNVNVYVARLDGNTGALAKAVGFGRATGSGRALANAIAVAPNGDVVIAGSVVGRVTFGTLSIVASSAAPADGYVAKLNGADLTPASGSWPLRIGGAADDAANAVAVDGLGQVWAAGTFSGSTRAPGADGRGAAVLTSAGQTDAFLIRFSADGVVTFSARYGDAFEQTATSLLAPRLAGSPADIWMGGTFVSAIQFAPLPALAATAGVATDVRNYFVKIK
jgi:hypothetical protein